MDIDFGLQQSWIIEYWNEYLDSTALFRVSNTSHRIIAKFTYRVHWRNFKSILAQVNLIPITITVGCISNTFHHKDFGLLLY